MVTKKIYICHVLLHYLYGLHLLNAGEDGVEEGDAINNEMAFLSVVNVDAIANIVRMLDKEEDARAKVLLGRASKYK